jgi:hypothetical protein
LKALHRLFTGPRAAADVAPYFYVTLHRGERIQILGLMRSKKQSRRFE